MSDFSQTVMRLLWNDICCLIHYCFKHYGGFITCRHFIAFSSKASSFSVCNLRFFNKRFAFFTHIGATLMCLEVA